MGTMNTFWSVLTVLVIIGAAAAVWTTGVLTGVLAERAKWNKLIRDGLIPKPGERL